MLRAYQGHIQSGQPITPKYLPSCTAAVLSACSGPPAGPALHAWSPHPPHCSPLTAGFFLPPSQPLGCCMCYSLCLNALHLGENYSSCSFHPGVTSSAPFPALDLLKHFSSVPTHPPLSRSLCLADHVNQCLPPGPELHMADTMPVMVTVTTRSCIAVPGS